MPRKSRVNALIKDLGQGDEYYREVAARTLGELGDENAIGHLITALDDPNMHVKEAVVESLGKLGDIHSHRILMERLRVSDEQLRDVAAHAIVNSRPNLATLMLLDEFEMTGPARKLRRNLLAEADSLVVDTRELTRLLEEKLARAQPEDLNEIRHGRNCLLRAGKIGQVLESEHLLGSVTIAEKELNLMERALISVLSGGPIPESVLDVKEARDSPERKGDDDAPTAKGLKMMGELDRLVRYREAGHLSAGEFQQAKTKLFES